MTNAEYAVQTALYELWYDYYTQPLTQAERNELAAEFTERWLDPDRIKVDKPFVKHPATRIKQRHDQPAVTVADVLADFVIHADQVAERDADYPITNADVELTREDKRRRDEVALYEPDRDIDERQPAGTISEADAMTQGWTPRAAPSVEQVRAELARVKQYAEFHAATLEQDHGYDYDEALRRIKKLRLERVRECVVCGGGFYPRNVRRVVCDQQHGIAVGGGRSEKSACELQYIAEYNANYYEEKVKEA